MPKSTSMLENHHVCPSEVGVWEHRGGRESIGSAAVILEEPQPQRAWWRREPGRDSSSPAQELSQPQRQQQGPWSLHASVQLQKCPALRPCPLCLRWTWAPSSPVTVETRDPASSTHLTPHQWQQTLPPGRL